jgi:hypothetical protein
MGRAGLCSSHAGSQEKASNMHHGMQALLEHHHHHEPHSICHEIREEDTSEHGRPTSESHQDMMKQVNIKRAKRAGLQKVLWTANITQLSLADNASMFDAKNVRGSSASVGKYLFFMVSHV